MNVTASSFSPKLSVTTLLMVSLIVYGSTVFGAAELFWVEGMECKMTSHCNSMDCEYNLGEFPCSLQGFPANPCKTVEPDLPDTYAHNCKQDPVEHLGCEDNAAKECKQCHDDEGGNACAVCEKVLCSIAPCFDSIPECLSDENVLCTYKNYKVKCHGTRSKGSTTP